MTDDQPGQVRMFDPAGRKLVWVQLVDWISAQIEDGTYAPESRLPSEAALQHRTGAARETIRQAIAELRRRGLIETTPGKGSFVIPESERDQAAE